MTSLEDTAYCFPLSEPEIERLILHASLAASPPLEMGDEEKATRLTVCSPEPNSEEFIKSMGYLFPSQPEKIKELFPAGHSHYRLRLNENGACIFLGEEGCRLPRVARPWYCLLFPAWFQAGELTVFVSDVCLATRDTADPLHALQRLDVSERAAREIFNRLITDWGFTDE